MREVHDNGVVVLRLAVLVVRPFTVVVVVIVVIVMIVLVVPDVEVVVGEGVLVIDVQMKVIEPGERNVAHNQDCNGGQDHHPRNTHETARKHHLQSS